MSDPRAFLDRLRAETAPVAHEPIARVEVPGMTLLVIEASERYEGCPGCEALRAELERVNGTRQRAESAKDQEGP